MLGITCQMSKMHYVMLCRDPSTQISAVPGSEGNKKSRMPVQHPAFFVSRSNPEFSELACV
jgi:hypothetical protein